MLATEDGRDLKDVVQRLQEKVPRRLSFAHRAVVIIGEAQAKGQLTKILPI